MEMTKNIITKPSKPSKPQRKSPKRIPGWKQESDINYIKWNQLGNAKVAIWHRPSKVAIGIMTRKFNLSIVITVQSFTEHVSDIQSACKANKIGWIHVPLNGANMALLNKISTRKMIIEQIENVHNIVCSEAQVILIHCAAGIHRTGVFTYSLLRRMGFDPLQSYDKLKEMREATWKGVGAHRIKYAEEGIVKHFGTGGTDIVKGVDLGAKPKEITDIKSVEKSIEDKLITLIEKKGILKRKLKQKGDKLGKVWDIADEDADGCLFDLFKEE